MSPNTCVARTFIRSLTWIPLCESKAMTCSSDLGLSVALRQEMGYLPDGVKTSSRDRPETAAKNEGGRENSGKTLGPQEEQ